jgi:hypothetical protein
MKKLIATTLLSIVIGTSTAVWAICGVNIQNVNVITAMSRWRTLNGADQAWVNNIFDGQSGEPTFPRLQEVGYLPSGATWNARLEATIQDSASAECNAVEIGHTTYWWAASAECAGTQEGEIWASVYVDTCMQGASAKYFAQEHPTLSGLSYRPSYATRTYIFRDGGPAVAWESGSTNSCLRVSTTTTGCN